MCKQQNSKKAALRTAGFNLIELMIVIAIIATLAAIALPSYSQYINRSRAIAAVVLTNPVRAAVTEYAILHHGGLANVNNGLLHMESPDLVEGSKDVESIEIQGKAANSVEINVVLADNLGTLTWKGSYKPDSGHMNWACFYPSASPLSRYAPHGCVGS